MSRKSKHRHRRRKARRKEMQARDAPYIARGELPPSRFPKSSVTETRDPRLRWANLSARGGLRIGFRPTGLTVAVDLNADGAEHVLAAEVARRMAGGEAGES